ncbi:copper resistance CopC family protein [Asanoa siamensis]|uniref:CopC domain-containing protein n=1 Tax=Asanoa siamensis TaxID=926357 RepID=A0ABQ4CLG0_9ACTN|nr:copper resistance CopC family protein [Asanoa siamensis]GIF72124.1 hypothetical protein Asi02nite_16420 [Asanoa siamensis]
MLRRGGALLLLIFCFAVAGGTPATADGGLVASDPAAGAVLDSAPASVSLTFSAAPDAARSHVAVIGGDGVALTADAPRAGSRSTLTLPFTAKGPGNLTVAYHVEFTDGGQTSGSLRFSVGTGVAPPAPSEAERAATDDAISAHAHTIDPLSGFLLAVDGAAVLVVLALLYLRRPYAAPSN